MEPLKEMFNRGYYRKLGEAFQEAAPGFDTSKFVKDVTVDLDSLSLNQRMRNTSLVLHNYLPYTYSRNIAMMMEVIQRMSKGYTALVFPDYVSVYGLNDFNTSMKALKYFTSFGSSEFAIREFLKRDFIRTINVMYGWSEDTNIHVRRLASEGSRPRLPWSFKLDEVIRNPKVTLPILENLKSDNELYVRKSVANHLNDISKDSPQYVFSVVKKWDRQNPNTSWIIKRGCRSLIKQGDGTSLALFNYSSQVSTRLEKFKLNSAAIKLNTSLQFGFDLVSTAASNQKLILHYRIHYRKRSGSLSPKVFSLKEITLHPGDRVRISKNQRFADLTTRKHFAGVHKLEILVNGKVAGSRKFTLST